MEPMTFKYEEMLPNFRIKGDATLFEGPVPVPPFDTVDPTNGKGIVRVGQDWWVLVRWTSTGWLNHAICGDWYLRVLFEQQGKGEFELMKEPVKVPFKHTDPSNYVKDIPFPATSTSVPPGLYKVTVALTAKTEDGIPMPIAAFAEGPVVQFYEVGP